MSTCAFSWCDLGYREHAGDHWRAVYVPVTESGTFREGLTVGAGVAVDDDHPRARVYVHIVGGKSDADEDAHMSPDEAVELIEHLAQSVRIARDVNADLDVFWRRDGGDAATT
jgi:hypothetical protein